MPSGATRRTPTEGGTYPSIGGESYAELVDVEVASLNNRSICFLTDVAGSDSVTATCDPPLDVYVEGQHYAFRAAQTNTGAVTLNIDTRGAKNWRDQDGVNLVAGDVVPDRLYEICYTDGEFRTVSSPTSSPLRHRGEWTVDTSYAPWDVVTRGGGTFRAYVTHISALATRPLSGADYLTVWSVLAAPGAQGPAGSVANTILVEDTIGGMISRTKAGLTDGDLFHVLYYNTAGDGGGGVFYWDAAATDTEDLVLIFEHVDGGTGRFKRVWEPAYPSTYAGVKFSGDDGDATDNLTALNRFIAVINDGRIKNVQEPAGVAYFDDEPDTFLADNWNYFAAREATEYRMADTAGAAGCFFQLGNAGTRINQVSVAGFKFGYDNQDDFLGGSEHNAFDCHNVATAFIDFIELDAANGLCKLGDSADGTNANNVRFSRCRGRNKASVESVGIDIQNSAQHSFTGIAVTAMASVVAPYIPLYIHPDNSDVLDGGGFDDCEFNHVTDDHPARGIVIDATNGIVTNQIFINVVSDHLDLAAWYLLIDTGAVSPARLSNIDIMGCRGTGNGTTGNGLQVNNAGNKPMRGIRWIGGTIQAEEASAVEILGGNPIDILIDGAGLTDTGGVEDRPAIIADAGSGLRVHHCYLGVITASDTCHFTFGVAFTGNNSGSIVTDNDFRNASIGTVDPTNIGQGNAALHIWKDNLGAASEGTFKVNTLATTPVTAMSVFLADQCAYTAEVQVDWIRNDGSVAGSHRIIATGKRFGGGATAVGVATTVHSVTSTPLSVSFAGNNMQFVITPASSANFWWTLELIRLKRALVQ